ncbi:hypothetical protein Dimus_024017 [Dionaea muscipula]
MENHSRKHGEGEGEGEGAGTGTGDDDDILAAESITLRPLELSDVDDFMVWASDDRATRFCSFDSYTSREQALEYIKNKAIPHPYYRAICLINGKPIGAISVSYEEEHSSRCRGEIGYVLAADYWGKGIATRAVNLVASSIFIEWPHLERLQGLVDVENTASQRVLEKAGFQREGVLRKYLMQKGQIRDMVMFSLLATRG